ncbi:Fusaric acid resistance protein family protein [compost metagenome]
MGVPLFFGALGMAKPQIGATATSFCLHFIVLISPLNAMKFDVATFFNSAQAMVIGVGAAVLAFRLLILRNPTWHGRRLLVATLHDLVRLTRRNLRGAESWFGGRMADRLLQLARHYPELPEPARSRWDDGLLGLDIGDELLHLRLSLAVAQAPVSAAQRRYLDQLEKVLEQGPAGSRADVLEQPSAEFLNTLYALPPSDAVKLAQGAVLQLQNSWRAWCRQQEESNGLA